MRDSGLVLRHFMRIVALIVCLTLMLMFSAHFSQMLRANEAEQRIVGNSTSFLSDQTFADVEIARAKATTRASTRPAVVASSE